VNLAEMSEIFGYAYPAMAFCNQSRLVLISICVPIYESNSGWRAVLARENIVSQYAQWYGLLNGKK
jgi:hypothetical protein